MKSNLFFILVFLTYCNLSLSQIVNIDVDKEVGLNEEVIISIAKNDSVIITPKDTIYLNDFEWSKIKFDSCDSDGVMYMAYAELNMVDDAFKILDSIIIADPYCDLHQNRYGVILQRNLQKYKEAIPYIVAAIRLNPRYALYYYNLGLSYFHLNMKENAMALFNRAIEMGGKDPVSYYMRAYTFEFYERLDLAIIDYKNAIVLDPEYVSAYTNLSLMYFKTQEFKKGIKAATKALEIKPDHGNAYLNRGICYASLGKMKKACENFEMAKKYGADRNNYFDKFCQQ